MIKYGLHLRPTYTPDQPRADPDALLLLSDACKLRMEWIIRELIKINRGVNALQFVSYKRVIPRDTIEIQTFNPKPVAPAE